MTRRRKPAEPDPAQVLDRLAPLSPYFRLRHGPMEDPGLPTRTLREEEFFSLVIADMAERLGTDERRVAASTAFFGFAARLWSLSLGSTLRAGRSLDLHPDRLFWRRTPEGFEVTCPEPRWGRSPVEEVLDGQLSALVRAWSGQVAEGVLWGNVASALLGAARVLGPTAQPLARLALRHSRLVSRLDPRTDQRRSCCLFYRVPEGGYCSDCMLTGTGRRRILTPSEVPGQP